MTMTAKIILFVAVFGIFVVVGKSQSYDVLCSDIRGDECLHDTDCKCSGAKFICNRFKKCNRPTLMDILNRQPCPGIFKKDCKADSECYGCKEYRLVCKAGECGKSETDTHVAAF